jgi:hypothetical protein
MATPKTAAATPRPVVTFNGDLRNGRGTATVAVSVAEVAALAILAVERWPEVERVHGTRLAERLI